MLHERNWRVCLCVQELCHPQDSLWILASIPVCRNDTGLSTLARDPHFLGFWILVGLGNGSLRSFLSTCDLDTDAGSESVPHMSAFALLSLSLDTITVGEVDELEEDEGWSISCLESVMDVEEWNLEEELAAKTGTTIGTKFSVLHCIRIPFFNEMWFFDRWSIRKSTRFHRKAFRAMRLLAYPRGLSLSRIFLILWRTPLPLHAFALLHWRLWLS